MFQGRKNAIRKYLFEKNGDRFTPFDTLLDEYLSGKMERAFYCLGIKKVKIHIDWLPDYRCIDVQGVFNCCYLDLQIEPDKFSIGYAPVEVEAHTYFPLESKEQVYAAVKDILE